MALYLWFILRDAYLLVTLTSVQLCDADGCGFESSPGAAL